MLYYIIKIDYKEFAFDERDEALAFADSAAQHQKEDYVITFEIKKQEKKDASHIDNEI